MNRTKQKPGTRGGYTVCATCESMIDLVKRYGSEMRYCPECQWYEWLIDGEWQEHEPTDIPAKNQAAIDLLRSWRDGDPQEQEETLRVIEELLEEPQCQRCSYRYSDVIWVNVPGEGKVRLCPECISAHMLALENRGRT